MKRCLVIGKGEAFVSFVHTLSNGREPAFFGKEASAFSLAPGEKEHAIQQFLPISFDECYRNQDAYHLYDSVYLFPDELVEGYDFLTLFRQLNTPRIFVITHRHSYVSLYKRLGANHVILSRPGQEDRAEWLAARLSS